MDNLDLGKPGNPNKPISLGKDLDKPIPLDLGGSRPLEVQKVPKPQPKPAIAASPAVAAHAQAMPAARITGIKTFFAKLHPGAIEFLDEQITEWLKKNPSIYIKQTNTSVGDLQAKNTEPNLIITIWY